MKMRIHVHPTTICLPTIFILLLEYLFHIDLNEIISNMFNYDLWVKSPKWNGKFPVMDMILK